MAPYAYMALSATEAPYDESMEKATAWDRQRAALREEITQTALGLFLAHGFDATTIDQIVAAVGVSRRSFFRYFGTKEDIVLGNLVDRGEMIATALAERPTEEGPWEALRGAFHASQNATMPDKASDLALGRMLWDTPSLHARHLEKRLRWQELFVPILVRHLPGDVTTKGLRASAIVSSALACLDAASEAWVLSDGDLDLSDLYDEAVAAVRA